MGASARSRSDISGWSLSLGEGGAVCRADRRADHLVPAAGRFLFRELSKEGLVASPTMARLAQRRWGLRRALAPTFRAGVYPLARVAPSAAPTAAPTIWCRLQADSFFVNSGSQQWGHRRRWPDLRSADGGFGALSLRHFGLEFIPWRGWRRLPRRPPRRPSGAGCRPIPFS